MKIVWRIFLVTVIICFAFSPQPGTADSALKFQVGIESGLVTQPQNGRLLVIVTTNNNKEPRSLIGNGGSGSPYLFARDATNLSNKNFSVVDKKSLSFPIASLAELPAHEYFIQALLISNPDLPSASASGNLYSRVEKLKLDPKTSGTIKIKLSQEIPPEKIPTDTAQLKFIKLPSKLLSDFYGRPMFLRAGIILPRDYDRDPARKYPLWVRIGGWGARYSSITSLNKDGSDFHKAWVADDAPRMILLQLDGAGPLGDPYQVNSANNGPYGDALVKELIPYVEEHFRAIGEPHARVLSGLSTGGWVSLALQIFYPDFFNGTWTFCPDGIDFRAFELVNIYEDQNAYTNKFGFERPSERAINGDAQLIMRREVSIENILGAGDSWTMSGGQWCTWNATYGPRGADGRPTALWDPKTGKIDHAVAEQWKKYDLRLVLQENWPTLGPKLQGKLHISVGDADNYFLNNAVHLMDEFLAKADPPYRGRIVYGPQKGHGWMDVTVPQMMKEMGEATGAKN